MTNNDHKPRRTLAGKVQVGRIVQLPGAEGGPWQIMERDILGTKLRRLGSREYRTVSNNTVLLVERQ